MKIHNQRYIKQQIFQRNLYDTSMNLDTQTLIHVGTELVVVGGIAFWLNKRIGAVDAKYDDLLKRLSAYEEIIEKQNQMIARHEATFQRMFGPPNPPPTPPGAQGQGPEGKPQPLSQGKPSGPGQNQVPTQPKSAPVQKNTPRVEEIRDEEGVENETHGDEDVSPDQLDLLLQQELAQLDHNEGESTKKERRRRNPNPLKSRGTKSKTKTVTIVADPR